MKLKSSVAVACFLPGWAKDLSAPLYFPLITYTNAKKYKAKNHHAWPTEEKNRGLMLITYREVCHKVLVRREGQHTVLTQTFISADKQRYKTGVVEVNHECSSLGYSTVYLLYSITLYVS
jgi:hypothetical protein